MPGWLKSLLPWIAAAVSGLLLASCFEPLNWSVLVWVWSWPLLFALWYTGPKELTRRQRIKRGFWMGYLSGFCFFATSSLWTFYTGKVVGMAIVGVGAVVGMGIYLGFYVALFGLFANTVGRLILPSLAPAEDNESQTFGPGGKFFDQSVAVIQCAFLNGACWVGLEWLRSVVWTGYSWNTLGVALLENLALLQFADTIGQLGYGFVILFCGVVGFATIVRFYREIRQHRAMRPHLDFALAIGMVVFLFVYGLDRLSERPEETVDLDIRIMQLNVPIEDKYFGSMEVRTKIMEDYRDLTRAFLDHSSPDLVMWSETALPTYLSYGPTFNYLNDMVLMGEDFYLLMGIEERDVNNNIYNTISVMKGDVESSLQIYEKMHLVPFGEYIPGGNQIPFIKWIFKDIIDQDFTRGTSYEPLTMEKDGNQIGIIPLICFEDTVARHARKFVRDGPQFLANVSNDGWFYDSSEPHQHFAASRFRCIELRRPMVRSANTGVSGFVDEYGSIYDRFSEEEEPRKRLIFDDDTGSTFIRGSTNDILRVDLNPPMTIYSKIGDAFSITLGCLALLIFAYWLIKPKIQVETFEEKNRG